MMTVICRVQVVDYLFEKDSHVHRETLQKCSKSVTLPEKVNLDDIWEVLPAEDDDVTNSCNSDSQNCRVGKLNVKYLYYS